MKMQHITASQVSKHNQITLKNHVYILHGQGWMRLQHAVHMDRTVNAQYYQKVFMCLRGWSGGAMVLGKLPVPGRPTIWMTVRQGPTALTVGAGGGGLDIFTLIYPFFPLSPSLWETARYRLKYCLKGPLNPNNQPTNQLCVCNFIR